jgi:hypothetical protein
VLARLNQQPGRSEHEITVYLRSAEKVKGFEKLGFKTTIGSLDDIEELERLASEFDIVFQTVSSSWIIRDHRDGLMTGVTGLGGQADADHLEGTRAILRGFKTRFRKTGVAAIFIHTVSVSGTSSAKFVGELNLF